MQIAAVAEVGVGLHGAPSLGQGLEVPCRQAREGHLARTAVGIDGLADVPDLSVAMQTWVAVVQRPQCLDDVRSETCLPFSASITVIRSGSANLHLWLWHWPGQALALKEKGGGWGQVEAFEKLWSFAHALEHGIHITTNSI